MAASPDNYAKVLFNDGEGVDPNDFNTAVDLVYAQIFDGVLGSSFVNALADPTQTVTFNDPEDGLDTQFLSFNWTTNRAFTPWPSTGRIAVSATSRRIEIVPGTIMGWMDEPFNGYGEALVPFKIGYGGTTFVTTAVGDATNPRMDLIVVTPTWVNGDSESRDFEDAVTRAKTTTTPNKRRRINFEISIVQGTPNVNPVYPAVPGDCFVLGAVKVPATHNAVHSDVNLRDLRWPMGRLKVYDVLPQDMGLAGSNPWIIDYGNQKVFANATGVDDLFCHLRHGGKQGRLMGVQVIGGAALNPACALVRVEHSLSASTGPTVRVLGDLNGLDRGGLFDSNPNTGRVCDVFELADVITDPVSTLGTRTPNSPNGNPMWSNGYSAGPCKTGVSLSNLAVRIRSEDVAAVSMVRFYMLEGL